MGVRVENVCVSVLFFFLFDKIVFADCDPKSLVCTYVHHYEVYGSHHGKRPLECSAGRCDGFIVAVFPGLPRNCVLCDY